jgi:competence protein ComEA
MKFCNTSKSGLRWIKSLASVVIGSAILLGSLAHAVNINTATVEILQNVKGIGPARAKAIVEERERNGAFVNAEDLSIRIRGIGEKTVEKMTESGLTFDSSEPISRAKSIRMK